MNTNRSIASSDGMMTSSLNSSQYLPFYLSGLILNFGEATVKWNQELPLRSWSWLAEFFLSHTVSEMCLHYRRHALCAHIPFDTCLLLLLLSILSTLIFLRILTMFCFLLSGS